MAEDQCYVCKDAGASKEMLKHCLIICCSSNSKSFHPTCLSEKVPLTEYAIVSYKQSIDGKIGSFKKIGLLCKDHMELKGEELTSKLHSSIEEVQRIQLL